LEKFIPDKIVFHDFTQAEDLPGRVRNGSAFFMHILTRNPQFYDHKKLDLLG